MVGASLRARRGLERFGSGAHGVTRPTLKCIGDGLVMGGWFYSAQTFSRLDGNPTFIGQKKFFHAVVPHSRWKMAG